jgi:hypothetical protein
MGFGYQLMLLHSDAWDFERETIVRSKKVKGAAHYLVKWKGWDSAHNSWEPEARLSNALNAISKFNDDTSNNA